MLRDFIHEILNEAERDSKQLVKINVQALKKDPNAPKDPKALQVAARRGPVFPLDVINFMDYLPDRFFPAQNRKQFVKWVANILISPEHEQRAGGYDEIFVREAMQYISDWINGAGVPMERVSEMTLVQAVDASNDWHESLKHQEDDKDYETENVAYDFGDGWKIIDVPPGDLDAEGKKMQHCVGGYCDDVEKGVKIYSLRDPSGNPHVTIEVENNQVEQIKGKQNKPPTKPAYVSRIKQWLTSTDFDPWTVDYFSILSVSELKQLFKKPSKYISLHHTTLSVHDPTASDNIYKAFYDADVLKGYTSFIITNDAVKQAAELEDYPAEMARELILADFRAVLRIARTSGNDDVIPELIVTVLRDSSFNEIKKSALTAIKNQKTAMKVLDLAGDDPKIIQKLVMSDYFTARIENKVLGKLMSKFDPMSDEYISLDYMRDHRSQMKSVSDRTIDKWKKGAPHPVVLALESVGERMKTLSDGSDVPSTAIWRWYPKNLSEFAWIATPDNAPGEPQYAVAWTKDRFKNSPIVAFQVYDGISVKKPDEKDTYHGSFLGSMLKRWTKADARDGGKKTQKYYDELEAKLRSK